MSKDKYKTPPYTETNRKVGEMLQTRIEKIAEEYEKLGFTPEEAKSKAIDYLTQDIMPGL